MASPVPSLFLLRYLNARNTFAELIHYDLIPIVNENDTVAVRELRFGDNDTLSAQVCFALVCSDTLSAQVCFALVCSDTLSAQVFCCRIFLAHTYECGS